MFTASILVCLLNTDPSPESCLILQNPILFETENECVISIAGLLNDIDFQNSFSDQMRLEGYKCVSWIDNLQET